MNNEYLSPEGGPDCVLISVLASKSVVEKALGKRGLAAALLAQEHHLQLYIGHQKERTRCPAPWYAWSEKGGKAVTSFLICLK